MLLWYGWNRWAEASRLINLKCPLHEIKPASRAFFRNSLFAQSDLSPFTTAMTILLGAESDSFDPNFIGEDDSIAIDTEFIKQAVMINMEFVQTMQKQGGNWLKRIENLYYINLAIECAEQVIDTFPSGMYWEFLLHLGETPQDDRVLLYGTYKYGYSRKEEIIPDPGIHFSNIIDPSLEPLSTSWLTPRLRKIAHGLKKFLSSSAPYRHSNQAEI
jgi:hypothetical protein